MDGDTPKSNNVDSQKKQSQQLGMSTIKMSPLWWDLFNFTTVAATTNLAIISVQSPIKTLLMRMAANTVLFPYAGGSFSFFRALYAGTRPSIYGSAARTTYVTTARNSKPSENLIAESTIREEAALEEHIKTTQRIKFGHVMCAAFGDIMVTQIPDSLSQLRKIPGLLPPDFKWYTLNNTCSLFVNGFSTRYTAGLINFAAMLQFENWLADRLKMENSTSRHATAGAISGAFGALATYPFSALKDLTLAQTKVTVNGQLVNETTCNVLKGLYSDFNQSPIHTMKNFITYSGKQIPLRMMLSGMIFSIIAGIGEKLGPYPLTSVVPQKYQPDDTTIKPHSFFAYSAQQKAAPKPTTVSELPPTTPGSK